MTSYRRATTSDETAGQRAHSRATTGPDTPLAFRGLPPRELAARIKPLIAQGLGDGSVAVRLNNQGIACTRTDVYWVRTGRDAPTAYGSFEEMSVSTP